MSSSQDSDSDEEMYPRRRVKKLESMVNKEITRYTTVAEDSCIKDETLGKSMKEVIDAGNESYPISVKELTVKSL